MKGIILTTLITILSLNIFAEDPSDVYNFQKHPQNLVIIIAMIAIFFFLKYIYNLIKNKVLSQEKKLIIYCAVLDVPFFVHKEPLETSEILLKLEVGETFYIDPNFNHDYFNKIILSSSKIGFFAKSNKYKVKD